jgi:hypothetical protein
VEIKQLKTIKDNGLKSMLNSQVACIVPVHGDTIETIPLLIQKLPKRISEIYLIINDIELFSRFKISSSIRDGVTVLEIPFQVGKLEAYKYALDYMLANTKCDILAQTDGRLKQPPEELETLINALIKNDYGMVIADRYSRQMMEDQQHRVGIITMFSSIISSMTSYNLSDYACGTRVYKKNIATMFLNLSGFGYALEAEQILICSMKNVSVTGITVSSNKQNDVTNSEKIEDVLYLLISYCQKMEIAYKIKHLLCYILVEVKKRNSFKVDLSIFNKNGYIIWRYANQEAFDPQGIYSTQDVKDGYALYFEP